MFRISVRIQTLQIVSVLFCALAILPPPSLEAQTFSTLFSFNEEGGWAPYAGVTRDHAGNLYGITSGDGSDPGTAFELKNTRGNFTMSPLFTFSPPSLPSGPVGFYPWSGVVFGPDGALYGTTSGGGVGGGSDGYGIVYKLTPPPTFCRSVLCYWDETVLYEFQGGSDGAGPTLGNVVFDTAGNLYGTTSGGGASGNGTVYELSPSNGSWTEKVLYSFGGGSDGSDPYSTLIFDAAGNLYGTTVAGGGSGCSGHGCGTVFELSPSGSGWTEKDLYAFQGSTDGENPYGGLVFDQSGNLYGSANHGGSQGGGTIFELSPSGGNWTFSLLYSLGPDVYGLGGPLGSLTFDATGSLYGVTYGDGSNGLGSVFRLAPRNGSWTFTVLHNFEGGPDGSEPLGAVIVDGMETVYGTASDSGANQCGFEIGCGTVWEITQ